MVKGKGCRVDGWNTMQLPREELEGDKMQTGQKMTFTNTTPHDTLLT